MSQRSPYNDRNKTEQKGHTRKSASAAKPKRAVADLSPVTSGKAPKKASAWQRAKAQSGSGASSSSSTAGMEATPRMKELRRVWWFLWVGALVIAVVILLMQQFKVNAPALIAGAWVVWLAAMGGAFYIEFGPMRKERQALMAAGKSGGKSSKAEKAEKPDAVAAKPAKPATPKGPTPVTDAMPHDEPEDDEPEGDEPMDDTSDTEDAE